MKRIYRLCGVLFLLINVSSLLPEAAAQTVDFPDANLEAKVREALSLGPTDDITQTALEGLTSLDAFESGVTDLTGLEHATGLTSLFLYDNSISDISALSGLTSLTSLFLYDNSISNISALSGLTSLTALSLSENQLSNISALSGLANVTTLSLANNQISNISALSGMTSLSAVALHNNRISNIDTLSGLASSLTGLGVGGNQISDISVLSNLTRLNSLGLHNNRISDISALSNLTRMKTITLYGNRISNIDALSGMRSLETVNMRNNRITDISPLLGSRTKLEYIYADDNQISGAVTLSGFPQLEWLYLQNNHITSIEISNAPKLYHLYLENNRIRDFTFSGLTGSLVNLIIRLQNNRITNISGLSGVAATELDELHLQNNQITNISPISRFTRLKKLYLQNNQITDITLSGFTSLTELELQGNRIRAINLSGFTGLTELELQNNQISSITLSGFTDLDDLYLQNNQITDLSGLSGLFNLDYLDLQNNRISNLSPLSSLFSLDELNLCYNQVVDISTLASLTQLDQLWIESGFAASFPDVIAEIEGYGTTVTFCQPQASRSSQSTFSLPEDIAIGENIGPPFSTTELGEGLLTYTLEGSDAAFFSIDAETGQLKTATESYLKDFYTLTVVISNVRADTTRIPITITIIRPEPEIVIEERRGPPPSPIHQDRIVFNEMHNAEDDEHDWLELKNISDDPVSLKEWEISIVTPSKITQVNKGEDAGKDEDIVSFPDYTLPAGGVLLILNTDPSETHLEAGHDISSDTELDPDASPQYLIASEMRLPATPYLLILRSATDNNATPESVEDVVGGYFRESAYYATQIWPLRNTFRPDEEDAVALTPGQVWRRAAVEALGYTSAAWGLSGYQSGLGYKSETPIDTSLGTPGYPNDTVIETGLVGRITVSEVMYATEGGLLSQAQWIELYNNTPHTEVPLNLKGWELVIEARDPDGRHRYSSIALEALNIASGQTVLLVSRDRPKSEHISGSQIYELDRHEADARKLDWHENRIIGHHGFGLRLYSPDGTLVDIAGNLDGKRGKDTPKWELPSGRTEDGARTSLIRQYEDNRALGGNEAASWMRAADMNLPVSGYYGDETDISSAGYSDSSPDPVDTPDYSVGVGGITVSEVMVASDGGRLSHQAQWIELFI